MTRLALIAAVVAAVALPAAAHARPAYAAKEKKACSYCHNPPGPGPLNDRGKYYAAHDHSFEGYTEGGGGGTAQPPAGSGPLSELWRMQMPDDTERVAVSDVTADKKARILAVSKTGTLTVFKPSKTALAKEATVDLGANASHFVVGHFAKDRPAVVVAPGAAFYIEGDKFTRVAIPDLADITGTVRFTDGTDEFFVYSGNTPEVWTLDLTGSKPLAAGKEMVPPDQGPGTYSELVAHATPAFVAAFGLPEQAQKPGVIGGIDPKQDGHFVAWLPWHEADGWYIVLADAGVLSPVAGPHDVKPTWKSPKLQGDVLDVAVGPDPLTGTTRGLYVLTSIGVEKRQRMVQFLGPPQPTPK